MTADEPQQPKLMVSWNLPRLARDLAAHLESVGELEGSTWEDCEEYLEAYNLSSEDFDTVVGLAWKVGCIDCGRMWDHYMVRKDVWRKAGLRPADYSCRECLARRLKRPLGKDDFTRCRVNYEAGPAGRDVAAAR
jgi:hypothetical protein